MQFALLIPDWPHPRESSVYYESLLSRGGGVAVSERRHGVLLVWLLALKQRVRRPTPCLRDRGGGEE